MSSTEGGDPTDPPPPTGNDRGASSDLSGSTAETPPTAPPDRSANPDRTAEPDRSAEPDAGTRTTLASDDILPATVDADALRDAVGARPRKRRKPAPVDLDEAAPADAPRNRKTIVISALAVVAGVGIAALVLLGRVNSERYALTCTTTQAIAEQGRAFPPWGTTPLPGAEWRPIPLPANAQCKSQELDSRDALEAAFLTVLLERANATLNQRNLLETAPTVVDGKPVAASPLDLVSMQLEQALLLSRAPERGDQRKQVERMQGDVLYWRATLRLRDATAAFTEAARQFDQAALARPLHVSDADAWAGLVRRLVDELHAGPNGVPAAAQPTGAGDARTPAPLGTALPVEPTEPATGSNAPAATPDAGVPSGGVLL